MKKKKLILIGVSGIFVIILAIGLYLWFSKEDNTQVYENKKEETKEQISGFNGISIMYETGPGTGEYSESKSSLWPEDGYIFSDALSGCENGGELSWNSETNTINLLSNRSDSCYVYFDVYIIPQINNVTTSNIETDSITLTVNATNGNNPVTTYYYSNNNGISYETSNNNTYTFNGLDMGTEYNFSVYVEDSAGYKSEVYNLSETTLVPTLADVCSNGNNLVSCITNYHNSYGSDITNIYYHTSGLANGAGDNSYRYTGANPNNFVCFGSNAETCPSDNLYRIIGVFDDEIKLIKNISIGMYYWSLSGNQWSFSDTRTTLNTIFLNNLGSSWSSKIAIHTWKVGGMTWENGATLGAKIAYDYEIGANSGSNTDASKIGLMYISDYYYSTIPKYWTYPGYSDSGENYDYRATINDNWLYAGLSEWTISPLFGTYYQAWHKRGNTDTPPVSSVMAEVRPCFYLISDTLYSSGSGTSVDPIRLS